MFTDFIYGMHIPFKALKLFIKERKYWRYLAGTILINTIVYILLGAAFIHYILPLADHMLPSSTHTAGFLSYLYSILDIILKIIFTLIAFILFIITFNACFFITASPVLERLTLQFEKERYCFTPEDAGIKQMMREYWMSLWNGLWLNFLAIFWTIILFPLAFIIPVIGFLPATLASAYFFGLSFLTFSAEHRNLSRKEFRKILKGNRMKILGFGIIVYFVLLIPFTL